MTLATMADRALPLKTRVRGLATVTDSDAGSTGFLPALDTLLADIAAAVTGRRGAGRGCDA